MGEEREDQESQEQESGWLQGAGMPQVPRRAAWRLSVHWPYLDTDPAVSPFTCLESPLLLFCTHRQSALQLCLQLGSEAKMRSRGGEKGRGGR